MLLAQLAKALEGLSQPRVAIPACQDAMLRNQDPTCITANNSWAEASAAGQQQELSIRTVKQAPAESHEMPASDVCILF